MSVKKMSSALCVALLMSSVPVGAYEVGKMTIGLFSGIGLVSLVGNVVYWRRGCTYEHEVQKRVDQAVADTQERGDQAVAAAQEHEAQEVAVAQERGDQAVAALKSEVARFFGDDAKKIKNNLADYLGIKLDGYIPESEAERRVASGKLSCRKAVSAAFSDDDDNDDNDDEIPLEEHITKFIQEKIRAKQLTKANLQAAVKEILLDDQKTRLQKQYGPISAD